MTHPGLTRQLKMLLNKRIWLLVLLTAITGVMPDLEFELVNSSANPVNAGDYAGQAGLLFFGFTSCSDVCPTALSHLQRAINQMSEEMQDEVTVLFVSVDPGRDAPEALSRLVRTSS